MPNIKVCAVCRTWRLVAGLGRLLFEGVGCIVRREMVAVFPQQALSTIGMDHPLFKMVYDIKEIESQGKKQLEGISYQGRLGDLLGRWFERCPSYRGLLLLRRQRNPECGAN